jgi:hypothetical protein
MKPLLALTATLIAAGTAAAQEAPPDGAAPAGQANGSDLAKQLANPVASLISVPFQNNFDCCYGEADGARYTLNIQPVVPTALTRDWNLVVRTIVPVVHQQETAVGQGGATGLGDTIQSFFFSPSAVHEGLVWAVGPVFLYPTGGSRLGGEHWGAGPTALILKQTPSGITAGLLANHIWSVAGDDDRSDISSTFVQPFLVKTFPDSTSISINTETTYDWIADQWTIPVNVSVNHIFRFGSQLVQIGPTARYYLESPSGGPRWGARLTITFLFPG